MLLFPATEPLPETPLPLPARLLEDPVLKSTFPKLPLPAELLVETSLATLASALTVLPCPAAALLRAPLPLPDCLLDPSTLLSPTSAAAPCTGELLAGDPLPPPVETPPWLRLFRSTASFGAPSLEAELFVGAPPPPMPVPAKSAARGTLPAPPLPIGAAPPLPSCLLDPAVAELLLPAALPTCTVLASRVTWPPPPPDPPDVTRSGSGEGAGESAGKMDEKRLEICERYGAVDAYTPPNHEAPAPAPAEEGGEAKAT